MYFKNRSLNVWPRPDQQGKKIKVLFSKGRLISKANCPAVNSSKKQIYYYVMCFRLFFWKKLKTPKSHFEIIWPLPANQPEKKLALAAGSSGGLQLIEILSEEAYVFMSKDQSISKAIFKILNSSKNQRKTWKNYPRGWSPKFETGLNIIIDICSSKV